MGNTIVNNGNNASRSGRTSQWKFFWNDYKVLVVFAVVFVVSSIVVLLVFLNALNWNLSLRADANQWGLYGDFIGGFFGVVVVIVSTYYLIETLKEQKDANDKVAKANEKNEDANKKIVNMTYLQQVDTKYKHLIEQYEKINEQHNQNNDSLHLKVKQLIKTPIDTTLNYCERNISAFRVFDRHFYVCNREKLSVQFRVLYQLFKLIDNIKDLDEENKNDSQVVLYAKLVRCQLNEDELILIRYNCNCTYGENMRQYVNKYNLLKHLPILSLMEFQYWTRIFEEKTLKNAIDTEFIKQKKFISTYVSNIIDGIPIDAHISDKYQLWIHLDQSGNSFTYRLVRHLDMPNNEPIDYALDRLQPNNYMLDFLDDFLHELFEYSNFQLFNKNLDYRGHRENDKDNMTMSYIIEVKSQQPLVLKAKDFPLETHAPEIHPEMQNC